MGVAAWFRPPRQVLTIFLAVAAISAAALAGLTWQLLAQDRDLEAQRRQVQLEQQADVLVAAMQRSLAGLETQLRPSGAPETALPPDVTAISITADEIDVRPAGRVLYFPTHPSSSISRTLFVEGERLEFAARDLSAAAEAFGRVAAARDPEVRAEALIRLARVHRKQGAGDLALGAYASLEQLGPTVAQELPASLAARLGRMSIFEAARRDDELRREAAGLLEDLRAGRWRLTQAQYETYAREARRIVPSAPADDPAAITRSAIVSELWNRRGAAAPVARQAVSLPSGPALVVSAATSSRLDALIAGPAYLSARGGGIVGPTMAWAISNPEGKPMLGSVPPKGVTAVRAALTSGLPWTLHVFPTDGRTPLSSPRRPTVLLILSLVAVVLSAGWYFIFRSLAREQQVARLQSDFVAAVSHEFRSPLTALTHAADLLVNDRVPSDHLRRQTYQVLARDTARLRTLVEGLLTFGRLEAGAPFQFEDTDVGALVRSTVADFQEEVAPNGYVIDLVRDISGVHARVDREAVTRALRNLLDNAVKYSPDSRHIEVAATHDPGMVIIAVRDHGLGIPLSEQDTIFDRFVRGAESASRRIQGTGIGLAMVRQIARAHGGDIHLSSVPGEGSVFTMRLPTTTTPEVAR